MTDEPDMAAIEKAVRQLTRPQEATVDGHKVAQPALLTQLIRAVHQDAGRTRGGGALPSERNALDLGAFRLYEEISGRIASMYVSGTDMTPDRDPRVNLERWFDAFELAWWRAEVTHLSQVTHALETLQSFAQRIERYFQPDAVGELFGTCPVCGETDWYSDSRGSKTTALYTLRREGHVEVRCHWDHDDVWVGASGLTALAFSMQQAELAQADTPSDERDLRSSR